MSIIGLAVGAYAILVLTLIVCTRKGQPRARRSDPNANSNANDFFFMFMGG